MFKIHHLVSKYSRFCDQNRNLNQDLIVKNLYIKCQFVRLTVHSRLTILPQEEIILKFSYFIIWFEKITSAKNEKNHEQNV